MIPAREVLEYPQGVWEKEIPWDGRMGLKGLGTGKDEPGTKFREVWVGKGVFPQGWSRNEPFSHFRRENWERCSWEMKFWIILDFISILFLFYIHLFQRLSSGKEGLGSFPKEGTDLSCSRWDNWEFLLGIAVPGILQIPSWTQLWDFQGHSHPNP